MIPPAFSFQNQYSLPPTSTLSEEVRPHILRSAEYKFMPRIQSKPLSNGLIKLDLGPCPSPFISRVEEDLDPSSMWEFSRTHTVTEQVKFEEEKLEASEIDENRNSEFRFDRNSKSYLTRKSSIRFLQSYGSSHPSRREPTYNTFNHINTLENIKQEIDTIPSIIKPPSPSTYKRIRKTYKLNFALPVPSSNGVYNPGDLQAASGNNLEMMNAICSGFASCEEIDRLAQKGKMLSDRFRVVNSPIQPRPAIH